MPAEDKATVFIVHWNRPASCAATARAFRQQAVRDIVIIDNDSTAENLRLLRRETIGLARVVELEQNLGWGPALNRVMRPWLLESSSEFCLISAHDAIPREHCLDRLLAAVEANPRLGLACPQYPDRTFGRFSLLHGVEQRRASGGKDAGVQLVDVPHGTLLLARTNCLREIGLFDERFFAYGDEHELGLRARRRGWEVGLVWGAVVENPETSTSTDWREYLFARNSLLLTKSYRGSSSVGLRAVVIAGNILRQSRADPKLSNARWRGLRDYFAGRFGPPQR